MKVQIEKLKKEIAVKQARLEKLLNEQYQKAKDAKLPFWKIFDKWMDIPVSAKEHTPWILRIEIPEDPGNELVNYVDYGEADRGRIYDIYEIVEHIKESDELTKKQQKAYCKALMDQNVGSYNHDW